MSGNKSVLSDSTPCESVLLLQPHVCDGEVPLTPRMLSESRAYSDVVISEMYSYKICRNGPSAKERISQGKLRNT